MPKRYYIFVALILIGLSGCVRPIKIEDELPSSFICASEDKYINLIKPEAEEFYKEAEILYNAKFFLKKGLNKNEELEMFNLYQKAANLGDWRARHKLVVCYLYGYGTKINDKKAKIEINIMLKENLPLAYYALYLFNNVNKGKKINVSAKPLYKAAAMGSVEAQIKLASDYFKSKNFVQAEENGLKALVCAYKQESGEAAYLIGEYLQNKEKNFPVAMEYYWQAASWGHPLSFLLISSSFAEKELIDFTFYNEGYETNKKINKTFYEYFKMVEKDPFLKFPNLFQQYPIPSNNILSLTEGRNKNSKLKDIFNGQWPHY